ncbi:MAG TPA: EAL domain-containing protein [Acidimicrobiales bacterium]|nr:EAL domain-containing protein [Acidimicrobiales bacterium]
MSQVLVGRQPIFDRDLAVLGYELLFRSPALPAGFDSDHMTATMLLSSTLDIGLDQLVGPRLAFINAGREFLVGTPDIPLPPAQTVIEVLEDVARDEEVIAGCRRLVQAGYTLALEDYVYAAGDEAVLDLVSMVKVDLLAISSAQLEALVSRCRRHGVKLVAENVETRQQLAACCDLGFDLFEGYLLSRPETVEGTELSPNRLACLQLVGKLCDPEVPTAQIEEIIHSDVGLAYRILQAAGAGAARGLRRSVGSVREGIVLLGQRRLRSWAILMLLADGHAGSDEQLNIAMLRARMCELVAKAAAPGRTDQAFTVGLLSALDLLMDAPLDAIVHGLPLTDEVASAVLDRAGPLGSILSDVVAYEMGGFEVGVHSGVDAMLLEQGYLGALAWANEVTGVIGAAA